VHEFWWDLTLGELSVHMLARAEHDDRVRRHELWLAWHQAALAGAAYVRKLPDLSKLIDPDGPEPEPRTEEELSRDFAELDQMAEAMNGKRH